MARTSKKVASKASKLLLKSNSKVVKSIAGSVLRQRKNGDDRIIIYVVEIIGDYSVSFHG